MDRPPLPVRATLRLAVLSAALASGAAAQPASVRFEVPAPGTLAGRPFSFYGLLQDRTGFLWAASEEGLARYDGVGFTTFRADPDDPGALPGNRVLALAEAPDGHLWACVDRSGLVRFDPRRPRFRRARLPASLGGGCRELAVDRAGTVWVWGGTPAALVHLDGRRARRVVLPNPAEIAALATDGAGTVWIASSTGLYRTARGRPIRVAAGRWTLGPLDARGVLWMLDSAGGRYRLFRLDRGRVRPVLVRDVSDVPGLVERQMVPRLVDRRGVAWFSVEMATADRLVAVTLATGASVEVRARPGVPGGLPAGRIGSAVEDREGTLWFATAAGLRKVVPRWDAFRTLALPPSAAGALVAPATGGLYAGALDGDLFRFVPGPDTLVPLALPVRPRMVTNVFEGRAGGLWLAGWGDASDGGLVRVGAGRRPRRYGPSDPAPALSDGALRAVLERSDGRVWVGTERGLDLLDPASGRVVRRFTFGGSPVWTLAQATGGRLWVGTYGAGLALLDPASGRARHFRHDAADAATISSDVVTTVHRSRAEPGVWWVGTYDGGLNRFEGGRFRRYTRADGMPGLSVKSLLEDARGVLWVGTDAGLVRLDPRSGRLRVFTEADGLPGAGFGLYDAAALPDGRLAFAVGADLVVFRPERLAGGRFAAPVVLRSLRVDGRERAAPGPGRAVRLGPGDGLLTVEAVALSFTAPERVRYAARLDGSDGGAWVPLGTDRSTSFSRLPPGRHVVRVRAGTASGAWSPHELRVAVVVVPPWWATVWARGLGALLGVGAVAGAAWVTGRRRYRARLRRVEAEREAERRLQDERERISRDLHDSVGAQVASLLSGIELARLTRAAAGPAAGGVPAGADPLAGVEADAHATLAQLRETIWMLHREAVMLGDLRDRVEAHVAGRLRGRAAPDVSVTLDGDPALALSPMQALTLYRVAQEAVSNALKHADARALTVALGAAGGRLTLCVADDGTFRAAPDAPGGDGSGLTGFGLGSMRRRAEALGGTFAVDTTGGGTRVRVSVPAPEPAGVGRIPGSGD